MKVILKEYVYKHGVAGDIVDVADGFARNYLIPRGLAVKATKLSLQDNERLMAESAMRRNELNDQLVRVSNEIDGTHLVFGRKAGSNGKLYGSVTTMDIAEALLEATGIDINRRRISESSLRELGSFNVGIRMGTDLSPKVRVTIVREEDLSDYLAELEGGGDPEAVEGEEAVAEGEDLETLAEDAGAEVEATEEAIEEASSEEPEAEDA